MPSIFVVWREGGKDGRLEGIVVIRIPPSLLESVQCQPVGLPGSAGTVFTEIPRQEYGGLWLIVLKLLK